MITSYRSVLAALALGLLLGVAFVTQIPPASAETSQERMQRNKQQHSKLWERVAKLDQDTGALADIIAGIDQRVEERESEIESIRAQLEEANTRHDQLVEEEEALRTELATHRQNLGDRARAIYMQGELTYLELLFGASGISDVIDRVFYVQTILNHDQELVSAAEQATAELADKRASIESQIADIDGIYQLLEEQLAELENLRGEKELSIKAINEDRNLTLRRIKELEEENKRIAAEIREIQNSASAYKGKPWKGPFNKPCSGTITSGFGMRTHPIYGVRKMHTGVDISAPKGTAIKAAGDGKVIFTGRRGGYGKTVIVDHGNSRTTLYAHMSRITCDAGDHVTTGSKLGEVGSTGVSTGNHLHFEVRIDGEPVDPMKEL